MDVDQQFIDEPTVPGSSSFAADSNCVSKARIPKVLPHDKLYTIQVAGENFKVSGASLSYDSPSYFTDYFLKNPNSDEVSIDRSPRIFEKISLHLQGYSIKIDNEFEFTHLLFDSNYLGLTKLKERLMLEPLIISVGGKTFRIPKEILSQKGNYPNYFSIIYNTMLLNPMVKDPTLNRPPPVIPYQSIRCSEIFQDLLYGLQGNKISVRDENHRQALLNDCRYYQFFALEQEIINHKIMKNPFTNHKEIIIGLQDIKKSGLLNDTMDSMIGSSNPFTLIKYSRPFVDGNVYRDLIVQLDSSDVNLMVNPKNSFSNLLIIGKTATKLKNILSKVTDDYIFEIENGVNKLTVLTEMNESVGKLNNLDMEKDWLDTLINVNNEHNNINSKDQTVNSSSSLSNILTPAERQHQNSNAAPKIIVIKLLKSQWTIKVQGRSKIWMNCLKFDGVLDKSHFNEKRDFL